MPQNRKSYSRIRGTSPEIQQRAKELRHNPTPAEMLLWQHLRKRQLNGWKFRRQHPLGRTIVDFCCPGCKLIVELDGPIHAMQTRRDAARMKHLESFGYTVIRFTNERVENAIESVLTEIATACTKYKK